MIKVRSEPKHDTYHALIAAAGRFTNFAQLVVRKDTSLKLKSDDVLSRLMKFNVGYKDSNIWAGTELSGGSATVYRFKMSSGFQGELLNTCQSLYSWVQPSLPEDLAFFVNDRVWFFSITHEKESYFDIEDSEKASLIRNYPALGRII